MEVLVDHRLNVNLTSEELKTRVYPTVSLLSGVECRVGDEVGCVVRNPHTFTCRDRIVDSRRYKGEGSWKGTNEKTLRILTCGLFLRTCPRRSPS